MMRQKKLFLLLLLLVPVSMRADHFKYSFFYSSKMNEGMSQLAVTLQ